MLDQQILREYQEVRITKNPSLFCHAPFTSMNFEQNGNVTVCCYNRTHVLGTYPQDNLLDIWHSPKANQLREFIKKAILPAGCEGCYTQFQSKNFSGLRAAAFDHFADPTYPSRDGRFIGVPKVMEFELSNTCNLECTMCFGRFSSSIRRNREHLPPLPNPYNEAFVTQLRPFIPYLREARFLGGEPFLIPLYYQIWNLIIQLNPHIKVHITTNGTILTNKVTDTLASLKINLIISIDSLVKDNYESIRLNAKFDRVIENVHCFHEYTKRNDTNLTFAVCPMRQNWRELPDIVDFCNHAGIYIHFNTVWDPEGMALRTMTYEELSAIVKFYESIHLAGRSYLERLNNRRFLDLIRQIVYWRDQALSCSPELQKYY